MQDFELTLLTDGQIWGNETQEQLDVLKKYGTRAIVTDLSILEGIWTWYDFDYHEKYRLDKNSRNTRTALYWTKSNKDTSDMIICNWNGTEEQYEKTYRNAGIRIVLNSNRIFQEVYSQKRLGENNTFEVEYGEYPQTLVDGKTQSKLEKIYLLEQLKKEEYRTKMKKTGKVYTFDSMPASPVNFDKPIRPISYDELVYNNQKYIRVWENCDRYLWVKVEPITWLIDEKTGLLISKKILLSGIRFADKKSDISEFSKSDMKYYLDNFMAYEILSHDSLEFVDKRLIEIAKEKKKLEILREELLKDSSLVKGKSRIK